VLGRVRSEAEQTPGLFYFTAFLFSLTLAPRGRTIRSTSHGGVRTLQIRPLDSALYDQALTLIRSENDASSEITSRTPPPRSGQPRVKPDTLRGDGCGHKKFARLPLSIRLARPGRSRVPSRDYSQKHWPHEGELDRTCISQDSSMTRTLIPRNMNSALRCVGWIPNTARPATNVILDARCTNRANIRARRVDSSSWLNNIRRAQPINIKDSSPMLAICAPENTRRDTSLYIYLQHMSCNCHVK
jgi:hypothetical protein